MAHSRRSSDRGFRLLNVDAHMSRIRIPFGNRKTFVAGSIILLTTVLLYTSYRLSVDGYTFRYLSSLKPTTTTEPPISSRKAAVIVENRPLDNLVPIILHFSSILGPEWPIHLFTHDENMGIFSTSLPFQRNIDAGRFHLRSLPYNVSLNTHASVSGFFTSPWLWEQMAPAESLLLFQADSIICSKSSLRVDDFLEYDFVGAPVNESAGLGMGYNGGLSLRNRALCLDIVKTYDWQLERHGDHSQGNVDYEDQWFSKKMRELPPKADGSPSARLPPLSVAMKFAVETMWHDEPLGYHQPIVWQKDRMAEIFEWCPEYRMCTQETFTNHNTEDFGNS